MANKKKFVRALAEYLVEDAVANSMMLASMAPSAVTWASILNETPLFGYPTVDEAEKILSDWLEEKP